MVKRQGTTLTKDDYDSGALDEESNNNNTGSFQRATQEQLQSRKIYRAKRPVGRSVPSSNNSSTGGNAFASIQLTTTAPPQQQKPSTTMSTLPSSAKPSTATKPEAVDDDNNNKKDDPAMEASNKQSNESTTKPTDDDDTSTKDNVKKEEDVKKDGGAHKEEVSSKEEDTNKEEQAKEDKDDNKKTTTLFGSSTQFQGFGAATSGGFASASAGTGFGSTATTTSGFGGFGSAASTTTTTFAFGKQQTPSDSKPTSSDTNDTATTIFPESYTAVSGEEDERVLCEIRCKTYRFVKQSTEPQNDPANSTTSVPHSDLGDSQKSNQSNAAATPATDNNNNHQTTGTWQERGVGTLKILHHPLQDRYRMVQRREQSPGVPGLFVTLNAPIDAHNIQFTSPNETFVNYHSGSGELYLFKFKTASDATEFKETLAEIERSHRKDEEKQQEGKEEAK